jgi:hypothetical protein
MIDLEHEFWRTRLEAKAAYKALLVTPDDPKLMKAYSKAWEEHQKANRDQFLWEATNS